MLSSEFRLRRNSDFKAVYNHGTKYRGSFGSVIFLKPDQYREDLALKWQLGVSISKKFGNAVERNRTKRQILSIFHEILMNDEFINYRIVYVAYAKSPSFNELKKEIISLINKARTQYEKDFTNSD